MQVYEQVTPQEHEAQAQQVEKKPERRREYPLILLQSVLCLILLLAALLIQLLLPELYADLRAQYDDAMERSILITADDVSNS